MKTFSKVKNLQFIIIVIIFLILNHIKNSKQYVYQKVILPFLSLFPPHTTHAPTELVVNQIHCYRKVSQVCVHMTASGSSLLLTLHREVFKEAGEALVRFICLPRDIFRIYSKACCVMKGEYNARQYDAGVPQLCGLNWVGKKDKTNFCDYR